MFVVKNRNDALSYMVPPGPRKFQGEWFLEAGDLYWTLKTKGVLGLLEPCIPGGATTAWQISRILLEPLTEGMLSHNPLCKVEYSPKKTWRLSK